MLIPGIAAGWILLLLTPAVGLFVLSFDVLVYYGGRRTPDRARIGLLAWALYLGGHPLFWVCGLVVRFAGALGDRWHPLLFLVALLAAAAGLVPALSGPFPEASAAGLIVLEPAILLAWWAMFRRSKLARQQADAARLSAMGEGDRPHVLRSEAGYTEAQREELEAIRKMLRS
jgi:hypothetical protein